jgi:hypothetical protein
MAGGTANEMMKQLVPALVIAVVCALVIPVIGMFGRFFELVAIAGWTVLLLWVMHRARFLPAPVSRLLDRLSPSRRVEAMKAKDREAQRQQLATLTAERVLTALDDALIGQTVLNVDVARAIEVFAGKKNPGKPLSIIVGGPSGSGRTSFSEGLSASLSTYGAGRLMRIDCASDSDIDFGEVGAKMGDLLSPVLLLDNVDKIGDQRQAGRVMAELTRLVDGGMVAGKPLMRRCIVVMTVLVEQAVAADVHRQGTDKPDDLSLLMRHAVRATRRIPEDLVDRVDLVEIMKPLADLDQIAIVWKTFCSMAFKEHDITIVEEGLGSGDGIEDFLIGARERWLKAGVNGAREAARYIAKTADSALVAASRAGHTRVRARWDRQAGQMRLDPIPTEEAPRDFGSAGAKAGSAKVRAGRALDASAESVHDHAPIDAGTEQRAER